MGFHVQLDLKAIEQAASAAGAAGIEVRQHLAGLVLMFHHVWTKKTDQATRELLMGWFAVAPSQVDRLVSGLVAFGHLEARDEGWRIKGSGRYKNLRKKLSDGGKKSIGNLKQFQRGPSAGTPRAPASTSSSKSGPAAPSTPAPGDLDDEEVCWGVMEHMRVQHCIAREMEPGSSGRPRQFKAKMLKAVEAVGIVDRIDGPNVVLTRWDVLQLLFERYLEQERVGLQDENGHPCTPPWPIPLFLAPGILARFKQDYDEDEAAA